MQVQVETSQNPTIWQDSSKTHREGAYLILCRDAKAKHFVQTSYSSSSPPLLLLPGVGCICTMGVDGGGGWGWAEHGNHLKVGWLLWRPAAAQWQQLELIELHRGGESCRAVESSEDNTHIHTTQSDLLYLRIPATSCINPLTWCQPKSKP